MSTFIVLIHVVVCIALILIVLLQTGKGADMGAAFGGGSSQTVFGSTGASTFLTKATTVAAVVFMLTSLSLAYLSSRRPTVSIVPEAPVTAPDQEIPEAPGEAVPAAPVHSEAAQHPEQSSQMQPGAGQPAASSDVSATAESAAQQASKPVAAQPAEAPAASKK
ncbi:MAG: preprotein translocase subunit SecG [Deltaproteobacteria bacterium]|nr:preprotein translocase subunit SecG [Deltaproteobacteria bacterium]